jgi:phosphoribosylanthranilate isomerase
MIVQIYEIQKTGEAERCMELGVDHLGSVLLSAEGWRDPVLKDVIGLTRGTNTRNSLIPLFQDLELVFRALDYYRPHYVHFCESLTDGRGSVLGLDEFIGRQRAVKERFPDVGIIRSVPIPQNGLRSRFPTLEIAGSLEPYSDLFLTDTWLGQEPVKGYIGITGRTADWKIARDLVRQSSIPVILAGGLSPENVYAGLSEVGPAGADSCTLTNRVDREGSPIRFNKDFHKVERFVREVRRAEKDLDSEARD